VKETTWKTRRRWEYNIKWIFRKWMMDMDRIVLAQDRDRLRALVNAVMILLIP
jgi:hypothetical protein